MERGERRHSGRGLEPQEAEGGGEDGAAVVQEGDRFDVGSVSAWLLGVRFFNVLQPASPSVMAAHRAITMTILTRGAVYTSRSSVGKAVPNGIS